jgi:hypothetical protein
LLSSPDSPQGGNWTLVMFGLPQASIHFPAAAPYPEIKSYGRRKRMSEQNPPLVSIEKKSRPAVKAGISLMEIVRIVAYTLPLVLILVIVTLALMGPAIGNIFSNIVTSL